MIRSGPARAYEADAQGAALSGRSDAKSASSTSRRAADTRMPRARSEPSAAVSEGAGKGRARCVAVMVSSVRRRYSAAPWRVGLVCARRTGPDHPSFGSA